MKIKYEHRFIELGHFTDFFRFHPNAILYNEYDEELLEVNDWKKVDDTWVMDRTKPLERVIQDYLDKKAKEFKYDSIITACSYTTYDNVFKEESLRFFNWRSDVWAKWIEILNDISLEERVIPTKDELILELPTFI